MQQWYYNGMRRVNIRHARPGFHTAPVTVVIIIVVVAAEWQEECLEGPLIKFGRAFQILELLSRLARIEE